MDVAVKLINIYESNYPEYLSHIFGINGKSTLIYFCSITVNTYTFPAPKVFSVFFAMLKPFIHERTRNKIQVFGHDEKEWKAALLKCVNAEELPVAYGGTKTDPDGNPNCIQLASPC